MSGSGLIYAAIALMWAAVLIPMWLRNHDTATENRSAERFGQAMRVLSRKDGRDEVTGHVADEAALSDRHRESRSDDEAERPRDRSAERPPQRRPAPKVRQRRAPRPPLSLVQRRARSLAVIAGLTLVMVALALVTPLPWWSAVPFAALLVAFVVHLRVQARQRIRRRTASERQASRTSGPAKREAAVDASRTTESTATTSVVQGPSRAVVVETKGQASASTADSDEEWRPNPLPLPTYVTAPKAVRPIKVIDLTTPGAWSSGRLFDDEVADEDLLAAQVGEDELDALLEQEVAPTVDPDEQKRRAVGD